MSDDKKKTIKEEMAEQALSVTINLHNMTWTSTKPINAATLRNYLGMFIEILLFNDIMNTVDANFMKKMGIKGKAH